MKYTFYKCTHNFSLVFIFSFLYFKFAREKKLFVEKRVAVRVTEKNVLFVVRVLMRIWNVCEEGLVWKVKCINFRLLNLDKWKIYSFTVWSGANRNLLFVWSKIKLIYGLKIHFKKIGWLNGMALWQQTFFWFILRSEKEGKFMAIFKMCQWGIFLCIRNFWQNF